MRKGTAFWILLAGWLFSGCKPNSSSSTGNSNDSSSGNPISAPADYLGAVGKAKQSTEKIVSTVGIDQAIKMFSAQEGRLPKDLNELVPGFLPSIPPAPAGTKYSYDSRTGAVKAVPR